METVKKIIDKYNSDPSRLMDILIEIHSEKGYIPYELNQKIANAAKEALKLVEQTISNYPDDTNILVVGVGNSCGIKNILDDISQIEIKKEETDKKQDKGGYFKR